MIRQLRDSFPFFIVESLFVRFIYLRLKGRYALLECRILRSQIEASLLKSKMFGLLRDYQLLNLTHFGGQLPVLNAFEEFCGEPVKGQDGRDDGFGHLDTPNVCVERCAEAGRV